MINFDIKFKNIIIYGKSWEWKSIILNLIAQDYKRIYSNIKLFQDKRVKVKNKFVFETKLITKTIKRASEFEDIKYEKEPWLIIVDESWINVSSRESMSAKNKLFSRVLFLWRKANCYIIWLTQRLKSIDINQRELSNLILEMHKIYRVGFAYPLFTAQKVKLKGEKKEFLQKYTLDMILYMRLTRRSYDTLETSILM